MKAIEAGPTTLRRFGIEDACDETMAAVDADGSSIVERFVGPDLIDRLTAELDGPVAQKPAGSSDVGDMIGWFWGRQTKHFTRLAAIAPSFVDLLDHDFMHR